MIESFFLSIARVLNAGHRVIYAALRWLGLLFGMIPKAGRFPPIVYSIIHYTFIISVTLVLAYYSTYWIPESRVTWPYWFVRRFYVAIEFLLFYLFVRLLIVGIQLFLSRDLSEFEDINRAWEAGLDALAREGFDLQWLPVFVISGATPDQSKSLLESSRITWKVNGGTEDSRNAALTFHACDEALFICLNDVGAMSRQLRKVASRGAGGSAGSAAASGRSDAGIPATMRPDQLRAAVEQTRRPDAADNPAGRTLAPGAAAAAIAAANSPASHGRAGETIRPGAIADAKGSSTAPVAPASALEKLSKEELQLNRRRLEYFCQLLVEQRGSYCPLNGLLQVIPLRWTQSNAYEPLMAAVGHDVQSMHDSLHLQFPVVCLHVGLEELTGLAEFIERGKELDSRFRDSRAGSRFPGGLAIDDKTASWVIERGMIWFRDWVYAEFAKNLASPKNRQLYQFLCALSLRRERLVRELKTAVGDSRQPVRLTGCYFSATGPDAPRQAFVQGVMQRLMSEQNDVAWQPEWRSRDRRYLWLATVLSFVTLAVFSIDIYFIWTIWEQSSNVAAG